MPPLLKLRARSADDKELRRTSLVEAARALLAGGTDWSDLRIEDVARRAGVAKPSVFRYFDTKEELVLAVYLDELTAVFGTLARLLARPLRDPEEAAHLLAQALVRQPLFVRLSTDVHAALARRISVASARRFKLALLGQLTFAATLLEQRLPALPAGAGLTLLLRFHAAMIGLWQLAEPSPSVAAALAGGGLEPFRIDFAHELEEVFVGLLRTMEVRR